MIQFLRKWFQSFRKAPSPKTTSLLLHNGIIRIETRGTTKEAGLDVVYHPIYFLNETDLPEEIGQKTLEAFEGFMDRKIPHPKNQEEWRNKIRDYKDSLQLKSSWKAFLLSGAKYMYLSLDSEGLVTITPYKNMILANIKGEGEFKGIMDKQRICSTDARELGQAIIDAFKDCE